jgi:hypothetical protein
VQARACGKLPQKRLVLRAPKPQQPAGRFGMSSRQFPPRTDTPPIAYGAGEREVSIENLIEELGVGRFHAYLLVSVGLFMMASATQVSGAPVSPSSSLVALAVRPAFLPGPGADV